MSSTLPIGPAARIAGPYVATDGQAVFTFSFPLLDAGDLRVETAPADDPDNWTRVSLNTAYTVPGAMPLPAGGTVVFATGRVAGTRVRIIGEAVISNTTDILPANYYDAAALDRFANRVTIWNQETREKVTREISEVVALRDYITDVVETINDTQAMIEGRTLQVPTRAALKAVNPLVDSRVLLTEPGRAGLFIWNSGNLAASVANDPAEGIFIVADDLDGSGGAWVRAGGWGVAGADVRWFGVKGDSDGTTGDGTDDAAAMQVICNRGGTYRVPANVVIRLGSTITCGTATSFIGSGCNPYVDLDEAAANTRGNGSWFYFDHSGIGFDFDGTSSAADSIALIRIHGCGSFRNQPTPGGGAFTAANHDWDFRFVDCEFEMDDFVCLNPTRFATAIVPRGGRGRFLRIRGQPLLRGIAIDQAYDCVHLDVHFWPYWSLNSNVRDYTLGNLQSLSTGRVDGLILKYFFTIFANIGWVINYSAAGGVNRAHGDLVYLDNCYRGMLFGSDSDWNTITINHLITFGSASMAGSLGIAIASDNNRVSIGRLDADNFHSQGLYIDGTNNRVQIDRASFVNYDLSLADSRGVVVDGGNTLIFNGPVENIVSGGQTLFGGTGRIEGPDVIRAFTPAISATSGSITTVGATSFEMRITGRSVDIWFSITLTNKGSAAGALQFALPISAASISTGSYRNTIDGTHGVALAVGAVCQLYQNDNSFPLESGQTLFGHICYRIP